MRYIAFFIVFLATHPLAQATHLRAADILVETLCGQERTYRITVVAYLNTQSNTRFGTNSEVHFGDGSFVRIPVTNATLRPDLGLNIAIATYTTLHTYPAIGNYTVTYIERDRSSNILNIVNSDDVPYVTFVNFTINPTDNCNNTPILTIPPLDRACYKSAFFHTPGAYDPDGDSLSYELSVPASGLSTFASYTAPNNFRFYSNVSQGNEAGNGNPVFSIDPVSGLLTWDAPGTIGEYNIAFRIIEWRKDSTTNIYRKLSTTTRDMQIVVEECTNIRPALDVPADICVVAGTSISEIITGIDIDNHNLKIEVFAEIVDFSADRFPATFTPNPPAFNPAPAQLQFQWQTHCLHVRQQPYQVVFKITDNPPNGPKLVNFRIWNIKVVGPPPVWQNPTLDLVNRQSVLNWSSYACTNASKIQVWRRTDSFSFNPSCTPGLPRYTGYNLIAELPIGQTKFTDTNAGRGLFAGARYCYRLLTYYNSPASTPSLVSSEFCFDPIETDEPVITHVTVEQTAEADGKIRISWRTPTGINQSQFPKPYQYEVFSASGLFEEEDITLAGRTEDTTFLDTGINTLENSFNYRVVLFAQPAQTQVWARVDTSAMASAVRLTFEIAEKEITLAWRDSVPWTNIVQSKPYHLIYRGVEETNPARMILIDSVNVTEAGFTYVDNGTFNNQALEEDKRYSYRVLTRGTYGNPSIPLLENFSQVVTTYPENDLLPCDQQLEINITNCDEYLTSANCDQTEYSNTLHWELQDLPDCRRDIVTYKVYGSASEDGEFTLLAQTTLNTFTHTGLSSYAYCYKVQAIDALGREGSLSESVCNDNCPYFLLPNVFTPNSDGHNDTFNADFDMETNPAGITIRCPRFVESVYIRLFNRWGNEVYQQRSNTPDTRLSWDGIDQHGQEVSSGVYYYRAEVTFNRLRPGDRLKEYTGWVQVAR